MLKIDVRSEALLLEIHISSSKQKSIKIYYKKWDKSRTLYHKVHKRHVWLKHMTHSGKCQLPCRNCHMNSYGLTGGRGGQVSRVVEKAAAAVEAVEGAGLRCHVVTGGGSGSYWIEASSGVYNEIQPGTSPAPSLVSGKALPCPQEQLFQVARKSSSNLTEKLFQVRRKIT